MATSSLKAPVTRVMALDYGTQKMGMASGVVLGHVVTPLGILPMQNGTPDWSTLIAQIGEQGVTLVLVGLPLHMDGSESALSLRSRKFARRLLHKLKEQRISIDVALIDERLSSRSAKDRLKAHAKVDAEAAALLIESYWVQPTHVEVLP